MSVLGVFPIVTTATTHSAYNFSACASNKSLLLEIQGWYLLIRKTTAKYEIGFERGSLRKGKYLFKNQFNESLVEAAGEMWLYLKKEGLL